MGDVTEKEKMTALIELWKETRAAIGRFDQMIVNCTLKNFALAISFPAAAIMAKWIPLDCYFGCSVCLIIS